MLFHLTHSINISKREYGQRKCVCVCQCMCVCAVVRGCMYVGARECEHVRGCMNVCDRA